MYTMLCNKILLPILIAITWVTILWGIDVTGTWKLDVKLDQGSGTPIFTFMQEGKQLKGTYRGYFGETDIEGTIKGDQIEFTFEVRGQKITYKGKINDEEMKGKCDYREIASGTFKEKKVE